MESVGDKINYPWEDITDPLYLPLKIRLSERREKLAYSSEREDFIQSGEDQFVRILRVLLNGLLIVFLYNYAVNILCIKTGDGYGFYCMLKQAEIDVQLTSNRKLPNFYEKVTDFLLESYRISK
jgi:hypothetical protein